MDGGLTEAERERWIEVNTYFAWQYFAIGKDEGLKHGFLYGCAFMMVYDLLLPYVGQIATFILHLIRGG